MEDAAHSDKTDEVRNLGVASAAAREITNVGVLDLSGMETPSTLR